jgi:hypothetical protein
MSSRRWEVFELKERFLFGLYLSEWDRELLAYWYSLLRHFTFLLFLRLSILNKYNSPRVSNLVGFWREALFMISSHARHSKALSSTVFFIASQPVTSRNDAAKEKAKFSLSRRECKEDK